LIRRKVVVEFCVHDASKTLGFACVSYEDIVNGMRPQCVGISIGREKRFGSAVISK
jgi:hypothetical protein